jgi:hypothetical protein
MPFVFPEIVVRKLIDFGIKQLRQNKPAFDDLFAMFLQDELNKDYGPEYRDQIWQWFSTTKIPVVQAWSFNAQKIPCISIHLANETEDESKAAFDDIAGVGADSDMGTGVFTVMVDVGIHTARGGDHVLWLYYIVSYILFKYKPMAHRLGLKLQTYSASDYSKDADKMANSIWTRWVRFRCTTQNFWDADPLREFEDINTHAAILEDPSEDIAASLDVDLDRVDRTANKGVIAERPASNDEYDPLIDGDEDDIDKANI